MVESQIINNSLNLLDSVKSLPKEELLVFAKDYLKKHVYISSKNLGREYLGTYYNLTKTRTDYDKIKHVMSHKFRFVIVLLIKEGLIAGYGSKLYKRVDIIKSLSTDIAKIDSETKPNEVHLVYYEGKFVNPKFYDLE